MTLNSFFSPHFQNRHDFFFFLFFGGWHSGFTARSLVESVESTRQNIKDESFWLVTLKNDPMGDFTPLEQQVLTRSVSDKDSVSSTWEAPTASERYADSVWPIKSPDSMSAVSIMIPQRNNSNKVTVARLWVWWPFISLSPLMFTQSLPVKTEIKPPLEIHNAIIICLFFSGRERFLCSLYGFCQPLKLTTGSYGMCRYGNQTRSLSRETFS